MCKIDTLLLPSIRLCILLCLGFAVPGFAQEPYPDGLRVFTAGNSHTNSTMNPGLMDLVEAVGHPVDELDGVQVAGAPLRILREYETTWDYTQSHLGTQSWDVLTLQTYTGNVESEAAAAVDFIAEALRHNPDVHVLLYTIWPRYPDRYDPPVGRTEATWTEPVRDLILETYPDLNIDIMPISLMIRDAYEKIDAGLVPNIPEEGYLFRDGFHLGPYGAYFVNATASAMIHGESPVGYPGISVYGSTVEPETAAAFQEIMLDILNTYPGAGFNMEPTVATRSLDVVVQGLPFSQQLEAINVSGGETWALAPGSDPLPAGLSLSSTGLLSGTTTAAAAVYPITVRMTDGTATSDREYGLRVNLDLPPEIPAQTLPDIEHAKIESLPLEAENGVGRLEWSLVGGALPTGMQVLQAGSILGVPGEYGDFQFTVQVVDNHPEGAQSDTRELSLTVLPPDPETAFIRKYWDNMPHIRDGKFLEPYWDFSEPRTIDKVIEGSPTATVEWDAFWFQNGKMRLGLKVHTGAMGYTDADSVDIYFDGNNSDEDIYNTDDFHFRLYRSGQRDVIAGYVASFACRHAVTETEYGYDIEINVGGLNGRGVIPTAGDFYAAGLDIVVRQGTEGDLHQLAWKGTIDNTHDTSGFGTICFEGEATPIGLYDIYNGNFTSDEYTVSSNKIKSDSLELYSWYYAPSWRFVQDHGFVQDITDSGNLGFAQVIETPPPGDYELRFRYKAPNSGLHIGVYGFNFDEATANGPLLRGDVDTPTASGSPYPDATQFLDPYAVPASGDSLWHDAVVPFTIPPGAPRLAVVNFVQDQVGATGIEIVGPVEITGGPAEPEARDDSATILKTSAPLLDVLANDSPQGILSLDSVQSPAHGTAVIEDGKIRYNPGANLTDGQTDTFSYFPVYNGVVSLEPGWVTVTIVESTGSYDGDADTLPDGWELTHYGNLDADGSGDLDGDGIRDDKELAMGRDAAGPDFQPLDWIEDFESTTPGPLQDDPALWSMSTTGSIEVQSGVGVAASKGLVLATAANEALELIQHLQSGFEPVTWTDFTARLAPFADDADLPAVDPQTNCGFYLTESGNIRALDGAVWQEYLTAFLDPNADLRYTVQQDYFNREWNLWIDGVLITDMPLAFNSGASQQALKSFRITQDAQQESRFDEISVSTAAPPALSQVGYWSTWHETIAWTGDDSPSGNPNGNNLSNVQEYAFGYNDPVAGTHSYSSVLTYEESGPFLHLTYRRNRAAQDMRFLVQRSQDLHSWENVFPSLNDVSRQDIGDGVDEITVRMPMTDDSIFLRIRTNLR